MIPIVAPSLLAAAVPADGPALFAITLIGLTAAAFAALIVKLATPGDAS